MRIVLNSLMALAFAAILAGAGLYYYQQWQISKKYIAVRQALVVLYEQTAAHAGMEQAAVNAMGYPLTISPDWFEGDLPINILAFSDCPWVDVAPEGDMSDHPPDPVLETAAQAGVWYNPNRGLFRVRVPRQLSDKATLRLYNQLNGSALKTLSPQNDIDPAYLPIAIVLPDDLKAVQSDTSSKRISSAESATESDPTPTLRPSLISEPSE